MIADVFMYIISTLAVITVIWLIIKKIDIIITLFLVGIILIICSFILGRVAVNSISDAFLPLTVIVDQFKNTLTGAGFVILLLGGYSAFMTKIKANSIIVDTLTKPLLKIRKQYLLIPIVFLLGNVLSLGVPSASNLAIILLSTLYPVLQRTNVSPLAIAGVIATTATIMPTPLGADNVAIAKVLNMDVSEYTFKYHAIVSLPTLILMTFVQYFYQKLMDKRDLKKGVIVAIDNNIQEVEIIKISKLKRVLYTILPLLPIILLMISFVISTVVPQEHKFNISVELATIISLIIAIVIEIAYQKKIGIAIKSTEEFWNGMGRVIQVVVLLVAANVFVEGLKLIGITNSLQQAMLNSEMPGFVLPLIMVLLSAVVVLISGSGTSLVFATIPLIPDLAQAANINPIAISVPMGLAGNLLRAVSPVAAVVIIVSSKTGVSPLAIIKRTSVPMIFGTVIMFILSMIFYTTGLIL